MIQKRTQTPKLLQRSSEQHQAPIGEGSGMPWTVVARLLHAGDTHRVGDTWSRADPWGLVLHPTPEVLWCQGQVQGDKVGWGMKRAHGHQAWGRGGPCGTSTAGCRGGALNMIVIIPVLKNESDNPEVRSLF